MLESKVEASSLSDITQIASNPPKYPRNPTEPKRPPLILYIARVPGSKDIILTTLKPLLKNVTAEDVAASLYYLHLNTADDARLLAAGGPMLPPETDIYTEKALPRKPLPQSARTSLDTSRYTAPSSNGLNTGLPKRKPVATGSEILPKSEPSDRRPLGPHHLLSEASLTRKPLPGIENTPPLRLYESSQIPRSSIDTASYMKTEGQSNSKALAKSFSITLIRRDPSSGAQWNVGTIDGHALDSTVPGRTKKPYFDMSIQLTTPGYNRFSGKQTRVLSADVGSSSIEQSAQAPFSSSGFERTLRMGGRPTMQHSRSRSEVSTKADSTRYSTDNFNPGSLMVIDNFLSSGQATGYTFLSPWQGQCQFSTSVSGRSLKCKHHLPAPISADSSSMSMSAAMVTELRFNLPSTIFSSSTPPESKKQGGMQPRRFSVPKFGNIREKLNAHKKRPEENDQLDPSSYAYMYPSDGEQRPDLPPRPNFPSYQRRSDNARRSRQQSPESQSGTSDDEDGRSRLDLSIGREKAGGGNRGKRAKLGKLIIHDEGLKMLDLMVAANMSVWWSVWEGS